MASEPFWSVVSRFHRDVITRSGCPINLAELSAYTNRSLDHNQSSLFQFNNGEKRKFRLNQFCFSNLFFAKTRDRCLIADGKAVLFFHIQKCLSDGEIFLLFKTGYFLNFMSESFEISK